MFLSSDLPQYIWTSRPPHKSIYGYLISCVFFFFLYLKVLLYFSDVGLTGNEADCSQTLPASDVYSFDEDSGDAVSPLQSNSQPSPRSHASPSESEGAEATSVLKAPTQVWIKEKKNEQNFNFFLAKNEVVLADLHFEG